MITRRQQFLIAASLVIVSFPVVAQNTAARGAEARTACLSQQASLLLSAANNQLNACRWASATWPRRLPSLLGKCW